MNIFSKIFFTLPLIFLLACGGEKASPELQKKIDLALDNFMPACPRSMEYIDCGKISLKKAVTEEGGQWVVFKLNKGKEFEYYAINLEAYDGENLARYIYGYVDGHTGPVAMEVEGILNFKLVNTGAPGFGHVIYGSGDANVPGGSFLAPISSWEFEENKTHRKDLEKLGALEEELEIDLMEDKLLNYGLSSERAETLGKLMNSYSKIKRALTSREKDVFTKELTGLSFDKASSVLVEEGYDALIERASDVNGADPEAIKELLNEIM